MDTNIDTFCLLNVQIIHQLVFSIYSEMCWNMWVNCVYSNTTQQLPKAYIDCSSVPWIIEIIYSTSQMLAKSLWEQVDPQGSCLLTRACVTDLVHLLSDGCIFTHAMSTCCQYSQFRACCQFLIAGLLSFFCPCILAGKNAEAVGQDKMFYLLGTCITYLGFYVGYAALRYMLRSSIEEHKGIHVRWQNDVDRPCSLHKSSILRILYTCAYARSLIH